MPLPLKLANVCEAQSRTRQVFTRSSIRSSTHRRRRLVHTPASHSPLWQRFRPKCLSTQTNKESWYGGRIISPCWWLTGHQSHKTTAQKAFDALSAATMDDPRNTNKNTPTLPSTIYKATERRASVQRMNLRRRHILTKFANNLRQLAAIAGCQAGTIPADGDTLVKLDDAANHQAVERIKDEYFDEDYDILQRLEELQIEFITWMLEAVQTTVGEV